MEFVSSIFKRICVRRLASSVFWIKKPTSYAEKLLSSSHSVLYIDLLILAFILKYDNHELRRAPLVSWRKKLGR